MKKIKIAQIGTSAYSHGSQIFESFKKQSDLFEVVGYALPENERGKFPERMWCFDSYPEMSIEEILSNPEIEAVSIETEEIYLTKYALMAAEHGKHVHMEKPGSPDLESFERLIETARRNKTVFHTGYMYRYNPAVKSLLEKIRSGALGNIFSIEAQMNTCHPIVDRRWLGNFPGGNMFFLGCHMVDFILQAKGTPEKIIPLNRSTDGTRSNDFGMAVLSYKDGNCIAKASANEIGSRRHFIVSGSEGTAIIDPIEEGGEDCMHAVTTEITREKKKLTTATPDFARYDEMIRAFGKMVMGEIENPYTYDYELKLFKALLKCCE